jgi:hypothetical protein
VGDLGDRRPSRGLGDVLGDRGPSRGLGYVLGDRLGLELALIGLTLGLAF